MKKKFYCIFLSVMLSLGAIIVVGCNDTDKGIAKVWTALSSEVFVQDILPETYSEAKLDFVGIKGETESLQVMITALQNIRGISFETADLVNGENVISKDNVKVYGEHYVEIAEPYVNYGNTQVSIYSPAGFYPDALIPFESFKARREDRVEKGHNQGIWIDVEIPADAESGEYSSTFKVILGEQMEEVSIPVTLKIYDLLMPEEVHSRSAFNIWYSQIASGEKSNYDANTNQAYYDFLLSKRLCSDSVDPNKRTSLGVLIDYMVELALNPKVTTYRVHNELIGMAGPEYLAESNPKFVGKTTAEKEQLMQTAQTTTYNGLKNVFTKVLEKNLAVMGEHPGINLFKKMVFYFHDEPAPNYRCEMIKEFNRILTQVKRDFIEENKNTLDLYPEIKNSIIYDVRDMTPTDLLNDHLFVSTKDDGNGNQVPDYDKGDGVTLWVLHCYKFGSDATRNIIKERQSYGEQFWWYTCCRTSPTLSYYVESKTMNMRLQGWQQFELNLEGVLYWDIAQWGGLPDCNPYKTLKLSDTWGNGEGILVYPGYQYGLKTPVSSIRLENIFQAQEDYEYLYMLREYLEIYNGLHSTDFDATEVVGALIDDMHDGTYIKETATPQELEDCRTFILDVLQKFENGDDDGAIGLIQNKL